VGTFLPSAARKPVIALTGAVLLLAGSLLSASLRSSSAPRLRMEGIAESPCDPFSVLAVPAGTGGSYHADSGVLLTPGGAYGPSLRKLPATILNSCVRAATRADKQWLRSGQVPGQTGQQREMATRALLDLRLSVLPDGAVIAGWSPGWHYSWPRDSSWVAVALAETGHLQEAFSILSFLQRVQPRSGIWAARYKADGRPVLDGRPDELDADGWVPWAVWSWWAAARDSAERQARLQLDRLWPMVLTAADASARSLTEDGLPIPAMDYWEDSIQVTLGTAAPLLAGLRAAADIAVEVGDRTKARTWTRAAARLSTGIAEGFGRYGFPRTPFSYSGMDASIAFLGPPFGQADAGIRRAASLAQSLLLEPDGGLRPGTAWPGTPEVAWTAETAAFALFDSLIGQDSLSARWLSWLAAHRTRLGEFPEQVNANGDAASVAPLAWTDAVVLLILVSQEHQLPAIPTPGHEPRV